MDALEFLKGTDAIFQKTQQQYADMQQGFVAPPVRQGTVLSSGQSYPSPSASNAITELPKATYDAGNVGRSVNLQHQTPTTQRYEGGYDAADQKAAADIPGFGTQGWTDIGPMGRAAMTMTEALPGIGAIAKAAGLGVNMSNVQYANSVREQMGMEKLDALAQFNAVMGFNSFGRNLDSALQAGVDMSSMAKNDIANMSFSSPLGMTSMTGPEDEMGFAGLGSTAPSGIGGFTGFDTPGGMVGMDGPEDEIGGLRGRSSGPDTARGEAAGTGGWDGYGGFGGYTSESPGTAGGGGGEDGNNGAGSW